MTTPNLNTIAGSSGPGSPAPPSSDGIAWFTDTFYPHFEAWVICPINRLVSSEDALIGFIFMSCAIDYLAGFWWGKSTRNEVGKAYKQFVDEYFLPKGLYDSEALYDSLRNGLVHLFTIKGKKYVLTHDKPARHLQKDDSGQTILNAQNFRDELLAAKRKYFSAVQENPEMLRKLIERYRRDGFLGPSDIP